MLIKARGDEALTHPEASLLHAMNLDFYKTVAESRVYRHGKLSVWVRVPVRQAGDATSKELSAFIPAVGREIRKQGLSRLAQAVRSSYAATREDGVVRRIIEDERAAREQAEKVFRLFERECPLALRCFDRDELWEAIYLGHRQNARAVPILPDVPGFDIRDYLCGKTIDGDGWYVMHGSHPACIVSMFVPPQPTVSADALRALTLHPQRHKDQRLIACWPCYHAQGLRYGDEEAERLITQTESRLAEAGGQRAEAGEPERL